MKMQISDLLRARQEGFFAFAARLNKGDVFYHFPPLTYLVSASDAAHMHWRVAADETQARKFFSKAQRRAKEGKALLAHEAQRASALRYRSALRVRIFLVTGNWTTDL